MLCKSSSLKVRVNFHTQHVGRKFYSDVQRKVKTDGIHLHGSLNRKMFFEMSEM